MRLFQHSEFRDFLVAASEARGLREEIIEKDYYVTEVLRIVADELGDDGIFKGGTSLSKGWGLIERFSEDIDLYVSPVRDGARLTTRAIDRQLKRLRDVVAQHSALSWDAARSKKMSGKGRGDYFTYSSALTSTPRLRPDVLLESGIHSGDFPVERRDLSSYVADFLHKRNLGDVAVDLDPFPMRLLHFRRTFVEKLFTIHSRVEKFRQEGQAVGPHARHYYDLACLAIRPEVRDMLQSVEYEEIRNDYDRVSQMAYPKNHHPPVGLRFQDSEALFPPTVLRPALQADYEAECDTLCFGSYPTFTEVLDRFADLREWL